MRASVRLGVCANLRNVRPLPATVCLTSEQPRHALCELLGVAPEVVHRLLHEGHLMESRSVGGAMLWRLDATARARVAMKRN
jgi:hypothetical protein